jgi:uncharacterized membrane protein YgcG
MEAVVFIVEKWDDVKDKASSTWDAIVNTAKATLGTIWEFLTNTAAPAFEYIGVLARKMFADMIRDANAARIKITSLGLIPEAKRKEISQREMELLGMDVDTEQAKRVFNEKSKQAAAGIGAGGGDFGGGGGDFGGGGGDGGGW